MVVVIETSGPNPGPIQYAGPPELGSHGGDLGPHGGELGPQLCVPRAPQSPSQQLCRLLAMCRCLRMIDSCCQVRLMKVFSIDA